MKGHAALARHLGDTMGLCMAPPAGVTSRGTRKATDRLLRPAPRQPALFAAAGSSLLWFPCFGCHVHSIGVMAWVGGVLV